jgi:aminopeptidase N
MRRIAAMAGACAVAIACAAAVPATAATGSGIGSPGIGDRFFPLAGNGGYRVSHYDLQLAWNPSTNVLGGTAHIDATTTQMLRQFDLDLRGFDIAHVGVNGNGASFTRDGQELVITPQPALANNAAMHVDVTYSGVPHTVTDPDGSPDGWMRTPGGAVALSEPQGAPSWFPANDHPSDKATFTVSMTAPSSYQVVGNGLPDAPQTANGLTTYTWHEVHPMATYLATVAIGHFDMTTAHTSSGIPIIDAVEPSMENASRPALQDLDRIITWESSIFGPYPFESVGAISINAPKIGYALETQTRPTFTFGLNDDILVHELSHQWFGDSVSVRRWPEIWLNEGFATYAEWLWSGHTGGKSPQQIFDEFYATPDDSSLWTAPPGPRALPGPQELFSGPVYDRGAMTLQALRDTIGDSAFFTVLRRWAAQYAGGIGSTAEFRALAEQVSGQHLGPLFHAWLEAPRKPARPPHSSATTTRGGDMRRTLPNARRLARR